MTPAQITAWRLHRGGLIGEPWPDPDEVVRRLGAGQAQDFGPAVWSIGQRLQAATEPDLLAWFDAGHFLRTHVLRPTWHFVLPSEIRWLLELTGPRVHASNAYYYRQTGLDDAVLRRCHELIGTALAGGRSLTRTELSAVLADGGIAATGIRLSYVLMHAELEQLICSGPRRGKQQTYALLAERAPRAVELPRDEALAELTGRYFASRGPASAKDFSWWSSLTVADVRRGIEILGDELDSRIAGEVTFYWHGRLEPPPAMPPGTVHLLQPYDECVGSYSETRGLWDPAGHDKRRQRATYVGLLLLDARIAGFWKRTIRRSDVIVDVKLCEPFNAAATRSLRAAVEEHGRFLGRDGVLAEPSYV
ncbi:MAG TPA: winged helix DNA-binding domain-containing protein [Jiangellaceae bacterium]